MRAGKEGGGKGALVSERSLTIATANDQTLFQPTYVRSHTRNSMEDADRWVERDQALTLAAQPNIGIPASTLASDGYAVRKLMPVECERLQGFPDGWTEGFPDTTRYRMLGNAVAVPVVRWIAERLIAVSAGTRFPGVNPFMSVQSDLHEPELNVVRRPPGTVKGRAITPAGLNPRKKS